LPNTNVVSALREVAKSLDEDWTISGRPLNDEEKQAIAKEAGLALGLDRPEDLFLTVRSASNNDYVDLVEHISNILRKK